MRIACVLAVGALLGCTGLTREQRVANSVAASKLQPGTMLTDAQISQMDKDNTYICEERARTGSHIPRRQCRTLRRAEREADNAQRTLQGTSVQGSTDIAVTNVGGAD
ncbi:MAG TPA: hypothetical protein VND93_07335 [Myxococcales bacterium]|jgi:hypothetical protein|nr:hypothetical protein [Myxococcales bacterium]